MSENINPNLMFCPDCGKQVSRRAGTCPQCGCPLQEQPKITVNIPDTKVQVQTIEKTGKKWKAMKIYSILMIVFGVVAAISSGAAMSRNDEVDRFVIGFISVGIGMILFIWAKIGAWWYHG